MSKTITPEEWATNALEPVYAAICTKYAHLNVTMSGDGAATNIEVSAGIGSGRLQLSNLHRDDLWGPSADIGSSRTITGSIVCARRLASDGVDICDALSLGLAMLDGVEVHWP